jgi:peptidoglycan/LPS O-acetylase OafA/YrhL
MTFQHHHLSHPKYRPDIDGLRAIAVLSVVAFHAFPSRVKGGFIGVDVFFVISGFLISTIIFENLDRGTFSFVEFYARRIKRIFPALILILVASFAFGWFALLPAEYQQLGKHIAAGAGFVSNLVFWNEAGYFDNSAETKPLLHLWSLGIEEQFYIGWPLLLWLAWKRKFNLLTITLVVAIVSFYLNLKGIKKDDVATFYSPQTRFWELLCGSLLAWFSIYKKGAYVGVKTQLDGWLSAIIYKQAPEPDGKMLANLLSFVGLFLLAYGFWRINKDFSFPGKWAVVPVLGAVLIITAGPQAWANRKILSNRLAVWFGLISFPLYLWHWPLLSFARIVESEVPSRNIRIVAVVISILLAWVTYTLVEKRVRRGGNSNAMVMTLVVLIGIFGLAGYVTYRNDGFASYRFTASELSIVNAMLPKYTKEYTPLRFSTLSNGAFNEADQRLKVLVIGDSYAQDLVNALFETEFHTKVQVVTRHIHKECGVLFIEQNKFSENIPPNLLTECKKRRIFEDSIVRSLMLKADEVWFASSWQSWHVNYIANSLKNVREFTGRTVRIFGRKNFGAIKPRELIKVPENKRLSVKNVVPAMQVDVNEGMRKVIPFDVFVDVQELLCGNVLTTCAPFTNEGLLIAYDGAHLTPEGAKFYGAKLMKHRFFKHLFQNR